MTSNDACTEIAPARRNVDSFVFLSEELSANIDADLIDFFCAHFFFSIPAILLMITRQHREIDKKELILQSLVTMLSPFPREKSLFGGNQTKEEKRCHREAIGESK